MYNSDKLRQVAAYFAKLAQMSMTQDTALTDNLRKAFGPTISQMAADLFANNPAWSMQVGISYKKPKAEFMVSIMSTPEVKEPLEAKLKSALDQKFANRAGQMISAKAKEEAFDINNFLTYDKQ